MSEEQLTIHHTKHHQAYVSASNAILQRIGKARKEGSDLDVKSTLKELSWNIGGHKLHSLFWGNLAPSGTGGGRPGGILATALEKEFGSFERFRKEFMQAASSVEGSGWAALTYCTELEKPMIMQVEKHNMNVFPTYPILMIVDVFEHAYYIDYKNDRGRFLEAFWNLVNWDEVGRRFREL
jgi:Fe-Mn family superoxide dismutase